MFALEPLPGNVVERGHQPLHLGEHFPRVGEVPGQAEPTAHLDDDLPVGPGVAGRRHEGAQHLHLAVGVGDGAGLLVGRGRRQDHVGEHGGFGKEDVLHNEMVELRQRRAGVGEVGVRHGRVLAGDIHAADPALVDRVHDLDHGQPRLRREAVRRQAPDLLGKGAGRIVAHGAVVGQHHRDEAGV